MRDKGLDDQRRCAGLAGLSGNRAGDGHDIERLQQQPTYEQCRHHLGNANIGRCQSGGAAKHTAPAVVMPYRGGRSVLRMIARP